ncbi:b229_F2_64 [Collinsella sp. CAG:289]|nr:b229_F2_64 [Collinsella sp. CAG:289]
MRASVTHGSHQIMRGSIAFLNQVSKYLGIGLAPKGVPTRPQLLAKLGKILDNAVMDNGDTPIATHVRMRVLNRRSSMRCPASMTNTAGRGCVVLSKLL